MPSAKLRKCATFLRKTVICALVLRFLDTLDTRILREVVQSTPATFVRRENTLAYRAIARKLSVSEGTVRSRVAKLSSSGVLTSWRFLVNPGVIGVGWAAYGFDVSPSISKSDVIDKLLLVDGLAVVENYHSRYLGLILYYENQVDLDRKLALCRKIAGANDGVFTRIPVPSCSMSLSITDWRILQALAKIGRSSEQASRELGMSPRTVKRRFTRMEKAGAVFPFYEIEIEALEGAVVADLEVAYTGRAARLSSERTIIRLVDDYVYCTNLWEDFSLFGLILPNVPKLNEILEAVRQTKGVQRCRIEIVDKHINVSDSMKAYVDNVLASTTARKVLREPSESHPTPTIIASVS